MSEHPYSDRLRSHADQTAPQTGPLHQALVEAASELDRLSTGLTAANGKLEAVEGCLDSWTDPGRVDVIDTGDCIGELETALASIGPTLRERIEKAMKQLRESSEARRKRIYGYDTAADAMQEESWASCETYCADLVQAALEGDS